MWAAYRKVNKLCSLKFSNFFGVFKLKIKYNLTFDLISELKLNSVLLKDNILFR